MELVGLNFMPSVGFFFLPIYQFWPAQHCFPSVFLNSAGWLKWHFSFLQCKSLTSTLHILQPPISFLPAVHLPWLFLIAITVNLKIIILLVSTSFFLRRKIKKLVIIWYKMHRDIEATGRKSSIPCSSTCFLLQ